MGFKYDGTGVDATGGFPIIEKEGWYPFRIAVAIPGKSKNGNYQVTIDALCLDSRWKDYNVRHWITFMPKETKGAGMALHFLSCIDEPHEGVFEIEPLNWERKIFMGKVTIGEYQGKRNNKFAEIAPMPKDRATLAAVAAQAPYDKGEDNTDPFA